ncbi:transposase [Deinococcus roseus]|uniref:Transposase n=1 Tax=Deinococcus roseus TaxID=392414 RepID=A0ABQ2DJT6_9DEIO|nr:transposase [Deinococcus roseus]GGJ57774.1 transposase [Deinococcus roseus]
MGKQRKNWPADVKQTIVLEVIKGEESVATIARRHEVSEALVYRWKDQFVQGGMQALTESKKETPSAAMQHENDQLKRLLAEKELELYIAKRARGL